MSIDLGIMKKKIMHKFKGAPSHIFCKVASRTKLTTLASYTMDKKVGRNIDKLVP